MGFARLRTLMRRMRQRLGDRSKGRRKTSAFQEEGKVQNQPTKNNQRTRWKPQLFAYRLLGDRTNHLLPLFRDLDSGLHKSQVRMSFKSYVSLTLMTSLALTVSATLLVTPISYFVLHVALFPSLLFGVGSGLLTGASTIILFYIYPFYRADKIKRSLDDNMAFSVSYLAILAGADVPPDRMFRALSVVPQKHAVIDESRIIVRDVELFGADVITALTNASKRTTSQKFKDLLEGFIATIRSGGDLTAYLMQRSRQNMRLKRIALQKFSDTLGVLSEFYVTLLIAGPLIFVVMLAVMAMLGGFGFGILSPTLLLTLLTYVGIPIGSIIFLIMLDVLSPR